VIALDRREPGQHSRDTHDRHYVLPDERIRAGAIEVIAAGAEDAACRADRCGAVMARTKSVYSVLPTSILQRRFVSTDRQCPMSITGHTRAEADAWSVVAAPCRPKLQ